MAKEKHELFKESLAAVLKTQDGRRVVHDLMLEFGLLASAWGADAQAISWRGGERSCALRLKAAIDEVDINAFPAILKEFLK